MKASVHKRYGSPDVISVTEVAVPKPTAGMVQVRIFATTVNRTDCGFRSAEYFVSRFFSGLFRPKQQILGNEFAGEITALGEGVTEFALGDKVFGYNDLNFGAHTEYMITPTETVVPMPEGVDYATAAAICEGGHYALCDIRAAKVKAGDSVLVYGATGAIGSAAVQLLQHFGARVTAVCATPHLERVRALGAAQVIDYTKGDFREQVSGQFDFIFDAVGKSSFAACKSIMKPKSYYISTELGKGGANVFLALLAPLLGSKKVLFPLPTISKDDILFLKQMVENGTFRPLIDREYSLDDIVKAYQYVETGQKIGNVVIRVV